MLSGLLKASETNRREHPVQLESK